MLNTYTDRADWERNVIEAVVDLLGIPNGDAQGIFEAQALLVESAWNLGMSAADTAAFLV